MTASRNFLNRKRWAVDQQKRARVKFAAGYDERKRNEDAAKLASLRQLAEMITGQPHMASTLVAVQAEIARLEQ